MVQPVSTAPATDRRLHAATREGTGGGPSTSGAHMATSLGVASPEWLGEPDLVEHGHTEVDGPRLTGGRPTVRPIERVGGRVPGEDRQLGPLEPGVDQRLLRGGQEG